MAQFKFFNEMNSLLTMDGPLTKGPPPRWERKAQESVHHHHHHHHHRHQSSLSSLSLNSSSASTTTKTPTKQTNVGNENVVIKLKKTPSKTPLKTTNNSNNNKTTPTPNKNLTKTPTADRFIPTRNTTNFDLAHYKINNQQITDDDNHFNDKDNGIVKTETTTTIISGSPTHQKELQKAMCENLHGQDICQQKILSYRNKAPTAPEGFQNPMRVLYTQIKTPSSIKSSNSRYIPQAPDRILDAPDIIDDYYLNLIDWSSTNILAAALGPHVYLWNAGTGNIEELLELPGGNDYVCSLSWTQEGDYLAVGTTMGTVELWDCQRIKRLRIMNGHSARVGSLSWNSYILSSGSRSGQIIHHDVRQRDHLITTLSGHTQEVCGLKWSPDGRYLASGGNDNVLNIWQSINNNNHGNGHGSNNQYHHTNNQPLHVFTAHQAAVKALAWCPWQNNLLASGGGTADRHIRFWNCNTGTCLNYVDTKSQVCSLLWSINYKELISGHGFANNELIIWKYPSMTKIAELTGHTARVLHLAMSPDGTTVLSAGADETLRLWKCFVKKNPHGTTGKTKTTGKIQEKPSILTKSIR